LQHGVPFFALGEFDGPAISNSALFSFFRARPALLDGYNLPVTSLRLRLAPVLAAPADVG
jgi:hypothetical protein